MVTKSIIYRHLTVAFLSILLLVSITHATSIAYQPGTGPVDHGVAELRKTMVLSGIPLHNIDLSDLKSADILVLASVPEVREYLTEAFYYRVLELKAEGFIIDYINDKKTLVIIARDGVGAMYGLLTLNDHYKYYGSDEAIKPELSNPHFTYRIIKFNLPWSPYREGPAVEQHMAVCRDLAYWERFLDMMAENRLNVLSLWNKHPFPYMIRAENFPGATPFNDEELKEWQSFWHGLFRMAEARGIQTFIVNWNIVVSPEFAEEYGADIYNDTSELVKRYTRESVTQVINEYPDLTGIGVTLADWMNNFEGDMSPKQREDWIEETFVAGIKESDRKVKFLHRSVLAGNPLEMRRVIDHAELEEPALVEIKFNWSHGHSTPDLAITHDYHSGEIDERFWKPLPENYNIQWMIRNEDFFILRWGEPDFIREHIAQNDHEYVNGYFIGSEGYIPALDYSQKPSWEKTWQYAFEKQWLFYKLWGRLLYDPDTPDEVFEQEFDLQYGIGIGERLLQAYQLGSRMPLRLASFYRATWDFTLYSEGFLAPRPADPEGFFDDSSPFISIDEFIYHQTLDADFLSIPEFVEYRLNERPVPEDKVTPLKLANSSEADSRQALNIIRELQAKVDGFHATLGSELADVAVWSHLGLYFAHKLRAGVHLELFRKTGVEDRRKEAVTSLENALNEWDNVIRLTGNRYLPTPHVSIPEDADDYTVFSWKYFRPQVERDIKIAREAKPEK